MLDVEVISTGKVRTAGKLKSKLDIVEDSEDVRNHCLLVDADAEDLALLVDADNAVLGLVLRSDKDGLAGDTVHVDARARLEVVEMDEAVFGGEVDDPVLLRDLHRNRKVACRLGREVHVDRLFRKWRVGSLVVDLDDVQLWRAAVRHLLDTLRLG